MSEIADITAGIIVPEHLARELARGAQLQEDKEFFAPPISRGHVFPRSGPPIR